MAGNKNSNEEDIVPMKKIEVRIVREWNHEDIRHLYRTGGWWKEEWDPEGIRHVISGSLAFAVGVDLETGATVAMGRVISDGVSDAYIQDVIVLREYRRSGIGRRLLAALVSDLRNKGNFLDWTDCRARDGTILPTCRIYPDERLYTDDFFGKHKQPGRKCYRKVISGRLLSETENCLPGTMRNIPRSTATIPLRIWYAGTIMPITNLHFRGIIS